MGKIIVSCKECNHKAIIEKPDESLKSFLCTMCGTRQKALPSDFVEVDDSTKRKIVKDVVSSCHSEELLIYVLTVLQKMKRKYMTPRKPL